MSKGSRKFKKKTLVYIGRADTGRMEYESGLVREEMIIIFKQHKG